MPAWRAFYAMAATLRKTWHFVDPTINHHVYTIVCGVVELWSKFPEKNPGKWPKKKQKRV
jgi:hypothetical protein